VAAATAGGSAGRLLDYCATGQHAIEGWLQDDALLLTLALHRQQRAAGIGGGVAEIGVHHGRFFVALALLCDGAGERALAVDVFADQHLNPGGSGHGDRTIFDTNLARWGVSERAVVRQQDSLTLTPAEVRSALGGAGARLFSVDGSHSLEHAANDLRVAAASLAPGGVVLLDDFLHAGWLGVTEAAVLMLRGGGSPPPLAPVAICGGKLALVAPADHAAWMERLGRALLPMAREAARVPFGGFECWNLWLRSGEGNWALWSQPLLAGLDLAGKAPRGGTLGEGWSFPESWGRWTVAERADCAVAPPAAGAGTAASATMAPPPPRRLALHLGTVLAAPGAERRVQVSVGAARAPLPPLVLREEAMRWHVLDLPPLLAEGGAPLPVSIACAPPLCSPAALGRGTDTRTLGVSLSTILLLA
jgi:hypothetical protein